jgi:CheY-like chemotaxis protein
MGLESQKYIVYADDDHEDQEVLKEVVAQIDSRLEVVTLDGGQQLLDYLASLKEGQSFPCLVVVDVNMPKMDGIETLRELKSHELYKKLPVIVFSTFDNLLSVQMAQKLGAIDYIKKPVTYERFRQVARRFIDICDTVPDIKNK